MMKEEELRKSFNLRKPRLNDANLIYHLVSESPPLDVNSLYSYLLVCSHFDRTSAVAESNEDIVGYTSAYVHPHKNNTLFVWQVAVKDEMRGQGLAKKLIMNILKRKELQDIQFIETTVTPENIASKALFCGLASDLDAEYQEFTFFSKNLFGKHDHEEEFMLRIGPFDLKML